MKKLSFLVIAMLMLLIPFTVKADKKVNVYLFRGEGCPHCEEAIEWFDNTLSKDEEYSKYYNFIDYEVWYDQDNSELMDKVAKELGTEASGVPFIVIGDKYFSGFSASASPDQIKNAIKAAYDNKDYVDVVDSVKNNKSINKDGDNNQLLPIIIVSAAAIVIVIALIFFTKERE